MLSDTNYMLRKPEEGTASGFLQNAIKDSVSITRARNLAQLQSGNDVICSEKWGYSAVTNSEFICERLLTLNLFVNYIRKYIGNIKQKTRAESKDLDSVIGRVCNNYSSLSIHSKASKITQLTRPCSLGPQSAYWLPICVEYLMQCTMQGVTSNWISKKKY